MTNPMNDYARTREELSKAQRTIDRLVAALHAAGANDAVVAAVLAEPAAPNQPWKYGDVHRCGASNYPHVADTACVSYALKHGDRTYAPLAGPTPEEEAAFTEMVALGQEIDRGPGEESTPEQLRAKYGYPDR